jgi:hypothetical protein
VIVALLLAAAPPAGLTLQEALHLPPDTLIARALGPTESGFREVRRPYLGGVPGRIDFNLDFASVPRPTAYPALCEANILSVYFWPQEGNTDPNQLMTEHSRLRYRTYRILGDIARLAGTELPQDPPSEATCAASGPVLSSDDRTGRRTHFFYVGGGDRGLDALQTYLAARSLASVIVRARTSRLPPTDCSGDADICDNPRRLLARLPLDRFNGFDLSSCSEGWPHLCVDGSFSPDADPGSRRILHVQIETGAERFDTLTADITARHVRIDEGRVVN